MFKLQRVCDICGQLQDKFYLYLTILEARQSLPGCRYPVEGNVGHGPETILCYIERLFCVFLFPYKILIF